MELEFSKPTTSVAQQRLLFAEFRNYGFTGLQLKSNQYEAFRSPHEFIRFWGSDPVTATSLITMQRPDRGGMKRVREVIGIASGVSAQHVILCQDAARETVSGSNIRDFAQRLSELGYEAKEQSVKLSLHHHYGQPVMYRRDFDTFFGAADPAAVGLTLDTGHLAKTGIDDIAGVVKDFADFLDNVHLKDYANGQFQLIGDGHVNFVELFEALDTIQYQGRLCVDEESNASLMTGLASGGRLEGVRRSPLTPPTPSS